MTLQYLLEKIDVEEGEGIAYFEQFADLLEMDEEIPYDLFYVVVSSISPEDAQDIVENYFEELSNGAPDNDDDLITLIENVKQGLLLASEDLEDTEAKRSFIDQLFNFREWFQKDDGALVDGRKCSVLEAVTSHRAQILENEEHEYRFPSCADYSLDSLGLPLGKFEKVDLLEDAETERE